MTTPTETPKSVATHPARPITLTVTEARVVHWALSWDLDRLEWAQPEAKAIVRAIRDNLEKQLEVVK